MLNKILPRLEPLLLGLLGSLISMHYGAAIISVFTAIVGTVVTRVIFRSSLVETAGIFVGLLIVAFLVAYTGQRIANWRRHAIKDADMKPKDFSLPPFPNLDAPPDMTNANSVPQGTVDIGGGEDISMVDATVYSGGPRPALRITGGQRLKFTNNTFIGGNPPEKKDDD